MNRDSAFGRYCFPQKLNEIIACETSFVAADVGVMHALLKNHPECRFEPDDADDFARAVREQLEKRRLLDRAAPGWDEQAALVDDYLSGLLDTPR